MAPAKLWRKGKVKKQTNLLYESFDKLYQQKSQYND